MRTAVGSKRWGRQRVPFLRRSPPPPQARGRAGVKKPGNGRFFCYQLPVVEWRRRRWRACRQVKGDLRSAHPPGLAADQGPVRAGRHADLVSRRTSLPRRGREAVGRRARLIPDLKATGPASGALPLPFLARCIFCSSIFFSLFSDVESPSAFRHRRYGDHFVPPRAAVRRPGRYRGEISRRPEFFSVGATAGQART